MFVCRSYLEFILPLIFILLLIALIHVQQNNFFKFDLTVNIDLFEVPYYLKHLLYDKGIMLAEALLYVSLIL